MSTFNKDNDNNIKHQHEDVEIVDSEVLQYKEENSNVYQLYDETIVTKRVKLRCKVCGVYMWTNYTQVIKRLKNLELTNFQQTPETIEELPVQEEQTNEPQLFSYDDVMSSETHSQIQEEVQEVAPYVVEDLVEEQPVVLNDEPIIFEQEEQVVVEENQEVIEEQQIYDDSQIISSSLDASEVELQEEQQEPLPIVIEEQQPVVEEVVEKHFKPIEFEFVNPNAIELDPSKLYYAEDNYLASKLSEKASLEDNTFIHSQLDQYFRQYNNKDHKELLEMIETNNVNNEDCFIYDNDDVSPYDQYYVDVNPQPKTICKKHKKHHHGDEHHSNEHDLLNTTSNLSSNTQHQSSSSNEHQDNQVNINEQQLSYEIRKSQFIDKYKNKKTWWQTEVYNKQLEELKKENNK